MTQKIPKNLTEEQLLTLLRSAHDRDRDIAFRYIYKKMYPRTKHFILKMGGTEDSASDIFQDAILIFFNHLKKNRFKGDCTIKTYLLSISKNLWLQYLRKNKRYESLENVTDNRSTEMTIKEVNKLPMVDAILNKLDKSCCEILVLYYLKNRSMNDLMIEFNLASTQAAKNKKFRCMKKVSEIFSAYNLTPDSFDTNHG